MSYNVLLILTVTVLELLAGAAWARVIASHLLVNMDRHLASRLPGIGNHVRSARIHLAHVACAAVPEPVSAEKRHAEE